MAKRVQVMLVDDTDGSSADETVSFGLDGATYEIDLSSANAQKLRNSLAPWIGFATKTSGGRRGARRAGRSSRDLTAIREWARKNGHKVSDRGRIAASVQAAYDKAHG